LYNYNYFFFFYFFFIFYDQSLNLFFLHVSPKYLIVDIKKNVVRVIKKSRKNCATNITLSSHIPWSGWLSSSWPFVDLNKMCISLWITTVNLWWIFYKNMWIVEATFYMCFFHVQYKGQKGDCILYSLWKKMFDVG
jgi:hypothetical protein